MFELFKIGSPERPKNRTQESTQALAHVGWLANFNNHVKSENKENPCLMETH